MTITRCINHLLLLGIVSLSSSACLTSPPTAAMANLVQPGHQPLRAMGTGLDTWDRSYGFLEWAFWNLSESEITANAMNYAFVFNADPYVAPFFRNANPDMNVGQYVPAFWDTYDSRPMFGQEDTPQTRASTLQWWNTQVDGTGHSDWVVYKCDGVTPAYYYYEDPNATSPVVPLDFTNPAVIDWQIRSIPHTDGLDATILSADMVNLRNYNQRCGIYRDGEWVQLFTGEVDDPAYTAAVIDWAAQINPLLHALPQQWMGLVPNIALNSIYSDQEVAALAANTDGILDEDGFTGAGQERLYGVYWAQKIRNMVAIQDLGAAIYSVNYVLEFPPSEEELQWIYGSYLMAREHSAYILTTLQMPGPSGTGPGGPDPLVQWPHLPEYDVDIGHPCGPMVEAQGVYTREFSKGMVVVNPNRNTTYPFILPSGIVSDLYGNYVEPVITLGPTASRILLSEIDRCP